MYFYLVYLQVIYSVKHYVNMLLVAVVLYFLGSDDYKKKSLNLFSTDEIFKKYF